MPLLVPLLAKLSVPRRWYRGLLARPGPGCRSHHDGTDGDVTALLLVGWHLAGGPDLRGANVGATECQSNLMFGTCCETGQGA